MGVGIQSIQSNKLSHNHEEIQMLEASEEVNSVLVLADKDYHAFDDEMKSHLTDVFSRTLKSHIPKNLSPFDPARILAPVIISIGAPKQLDILETQKFPVFIASSHTATRRWQVNPKTNFFIFAKHHDTGQAFVFSPPEVDRKLHSPKKSGFGTPPDKQMGKARSNDVNSIEFYESNRDKLSNGNWSIYAVEYDVLSNRIELTLNNAGEHVPTIPENPDYLRYFELNEPIVENRVKVMPTENKDVKMRLALKIDPSASLMQGAINQKQVTINLLILPLDDLAKVINVTLPLKQFPSENATIFNTAFEVNLSQATEYKIINKKSMVFVDDGFGLLGPFEVTF